METRIEFITGPLGGGKTCFAVERILAALANGRTVCTNVELVWAECKAYVAARHGVELEDDQLAVIKGDSESLRKWHEGGLRRGTEGQPVLAVIDEIHLGANAQDWNSSDSKATNRRGVELCTQARKLCIDLVFITQAQALANKQLRLLAEVRWVCRDLGKLNIPMFGKFWPWPLWLRVCRDMRDDRAIQDWRVQKPDRWVWKCYKTRQLIVDFGLVQVTDRKLKKVKQRGKTMARLAFIALTVAGALAYWIFGGSGNLVAKTSTSTEAGAVASLSPVRVVGKAAAAGKNPEPEPERVCRGMMGLPETPMAVWVFLDPDARWVQVARAAVGETHVRYRDQEYRILW